MTDAHQGLSIPDLPPDCDLIRAALAYAACGWYVGPVARGTKNPGSILGEHWPSKSSRDTDQIVEWFAGTDAAGIFLHVGRSGGIAWDIDHPENVPDDLAKFLWLDEADGTRRPLVPFQQTRPDVDRFRGHYLTAQPPGRKIGNSVGDLGNGWGEVRGTNGVIVVFPTEHPDGGEYRWVLTGVVPETADAIAIRLPDGGDHESAVTDDDVEMFLDSCTKCTRAGLMKEPSSQFARRVQKGESRHDTMVSVLCLAMRDAAQGWYPARSIVETLEFQFCEALKGERRRWPKSEFRSILAFAVAQAMVIDPEERKEEVRARLEARDEARLAEPPPPMDSGEKPDHMKYFLDKHVGFDVAKAADDVIALGPLALGLDEAFWRYDHGVWTRDQKVVRSRMVYLLGPYYKGDRSNNTEHVVASRLPVLRCDPIEQFWNCRNGMLNWRTGELLPHDPEYMSTVQFPWDWDPDATCPEFDRFLSEVLSPDFVALAWQMIAYLLYSGNPRQVAFMLFGTGSNGKGTLMRVLHALLGGENYSTASLTSINKNRFSTITLFGKIANLAGDIDGTYQEDTAPFKTITGEDMLDGEHKYGARIQFRSWAVPVFSANKVPPSSDTGQGYMRRWQVIRFEREFGRAERVDGLSDRLVAEVSGIAAKALPILRDLMAAKWFKADGEIAEALAEFGRAIDQVRQWVDETGERVEGHRELRSTLYQSYRAWASTMGNTPVKAQEFSNRLAAAGFPLVKSSNYYHDGLRAREMRMQGTVVTDPFTGEDVDLAAKS